MLVGRQISLRPLRRDEIGPLHQRSLDLEARGPWYPLPGTPLVKFEAAFAESGFWSRDEGIFAIVDETDRLVGIVGWGLLNGDLPDVAVSYRLLDQVDRGKGGHMNRLRADVQEATARESWYNGGRWHDVAVYTITRGEFEARRGAAAPA